MAYGLWLPRRQPLLPHLSGPTMPKKGKPDDGDDMSFSDLDMSAWNNPADMPEHAKKSGGAVAILSGLRNKPTNTDESFVVDKAIQLDPYLAAQAGAPVPTAEQLSANRKVDRAQYPGAEHFANATVFLVVDGHTPDARTTAAADALRALMAASGGTEQAVAELQQAAVAAAGAIGSLGEHYAVASGGAAPTAQTMGAVPRSTVSVLQAGLTSTKAHSDAAAAEIGHLRQAATARQAQCDRLVPALSRCSGQLNLSPMRRYAQFEQVRQDVLQVLIKPMRGVGAVAKMQMKEECASLPLCGEARRRLRIFLCRALKTTHAAFSAADRSLVELIEQKQPVLAKVFEKILSDVTVLLERFCQTTSDVVRGCVQ